MRLHRLPLGRQRLDAEFALLIGEGLFYSLMVLALPVLAWLWPTATLRWLLLDQSESLPSRQSRVHGICAESTCSSGFRHSLRFA